MPNNDYPTLDGIVPSWADIIVKASPYGGALLDIKDIAAINTGTTVEVGSQQGASGGRIMARTTGAVTHEASWTLYRSGYQKLVRGLQLIAPVRGNQRLVSLVHFDIQVQHTPPGSIEIYEYRLKGCRLLGRQMNSAEGTEAERVEVPLSVLSIVDVVDGAEVVYL